MKVFVTLFCAIVPALVILDYFRKRDLYPEPRAVLTKTFLLGILATIPVFLLNIPLAAFVDYSSHPLSVGYYYAFICAAIPEEYFKYLVLTRYCARHPEFDEPMDGVVYGVTASLGFATLENLIYVVNGGWGVAIARALTAVPGHACLGAIMGYYIGRARFSKNPGRLMIRGLFIAITLHALYDLPLFMLQSMDIGNWSAVDPAHKVSVWFLISLFCVVFVGELIWTMLIVKRLRGEQEATKGK